jgi:hypothetical protein
MGYSLHRRAGSRNEIHYARPALSISTKILATASLWPARDGKKEPITPELKRFWSEAARVLGMFPNRAQ